MTQKIPYPAKDPRYLKVWYQIQKRGKTLEEALEIVNNKSTPVESDELISTLKNLESRLTALQQSIDRQIKKSTNEAKEDKFGIVVMIYDMTYLIHEDLLRLEQLGKQIMEILNAPR